MSLNNSYNAVKSELKIGPVTLPNRIVFPAWNLNYANEDGTVTDKLQKFYTDLAEGGCGLIMTGNAIITPEGNSFNGVMGIYDDKFIPGLEKLFSEIKARQAVPGIQLNHLGRQSSTSQSGDVLLAPSAIPCPVMSQFDPKYEVREMTSGDIKKVREDFISAAKRAVRAGAEVVEIHLAHGYLLNQFLSPYSNKRTDDYGGSTKNRLRLIIEILEGVREVVKDKAALSVRISGDEFVEGGLKPEDYKEIIPALEDAGAGLINVSAGVYQSMERIVPPITLGPLPHAAIAGQINAFASVPVCAVGSIFTLEAAEEILKDGKADLCAIGRAQMADPGIVNKSLLDRKDMITKCIQCNNCTFWTTGDPFAYCSVNQDYGKPKEVKSGVV